MVGFELVGLVGARIPVEASHTNGQNNSNNRPKLPLSAPYDLLDWRKILSEWSED